MKSLGISMESFMLFDHNASSMKSLVCAATSFSTLDVMAGKAQTVCKVVAQRSQWSHQRLLSIGSETAIICLEGSMTGGENLDHCVLDHQTNKQMQYTVWNHTANANAFKQGSCCTTAIHHF